MRDQMQDLYLSTFLQLRLSVGFLGERTQFAWWPTAFYEPSSHLFLGPVFSKHPALHNTMESWRRLGGFMMSI